MNHSLQLFALGLALMIGIQTSAHTKEKTTGEPQDTLVWYDRPATRWETEALPVGNGRLGAMIFGGVERERIQLNEDSLWTGDDCPSGDYGKMGAYQNLGDVLIRLDSAGAAPGASCPSGHKAYCGREEIAYSADDQDDTKWCVEHHGKPVVCELCQIAEIHPAGMQVAVASTPPEGYRRELNLADAVARVEFSNDGVVHRREVFASHPAQLIVAHWTANKRAAISGTVELQGAHGETSSTDGATLSFQGELDNGLQYEAIVRVLVRGGTVEVVGEKLQLNGCDEAMLLLAAGTDYAMDPAKNYRGTHPHQRLVERLQAAAEKTYEQLKAEHVADYQALFNRVTLDLGPAPAGRLAMPTDQRLKAYRAQAGDPGLEALLFQYGRYLLVSCSRRPGLPANLQGLWNESNSPPWSSDYHANINVQMNYWPAEPANLAECHLPLFDLIQSQVPLWRKATQADREFQITSGQVRGWALRTSHNIYGGLGWKWDKTANAWYCQHLWWHYEFNRDQEFLRSVAYPLIKETCEFWQDHLKTLPDGRLVVPNAWSPEHGPDEDGVSYSQEIVWDLLNNYVEAADALGVDDAYRDTVAAMRDKLVTPKIGRWGQLQEWMVDRDDPKDQHRHTSHLFAVYPGRQISMTRAPELAKAAAVSLEARGTAGDSRRSWTWPWRAALWARLRNAAEAHAMVQGLLTHNILPNLFGNHPPFQMDGNFGITAGICEMLLQSQAGEIELLPALPAAWKTGSVKGLRARGNFTVDIQWKDGKVTDYRIASPTPRDVQVRVNDSVTTVTAERL